jgi:hypothetical protein
MPVDSRPCATHGRAPLHRVEAREILSEKRGTSDMVRLDYRMWQ